MAFLSGLGGGQVARDPASRGEQARYLHRGARRRGREELLPHLVEIEEVAELGDEPLRLHGVLRRAARRAVRLERVFQRGARLLLDVRAVVRKRAVLPRLRRAVRGAVERLAGEHAALDPLALHALRTGNEVDLDLAPR